MHDINHYTIYLLFWTTLRSGALICYHRRPIYHCSSPQIRKRGYAPAPVDKLAGIDDNTERVFWLVYLLLSVVGDLFDTLWTHKHVTEDRTARGDSRVPSFDFLPSIFSCWPRTLNWPYAAAASLPSPRKANQRVAPYREFKFYEFFSFLKFNEFYEFFSVEKNSQKIVILQIIDV